MIFGIQKGGKDEHWRHRLDSGLFRPGTAYDARVGAVLRRPGPGQKRRGHHNAQLHDHRDCGCGLGIVGLHPGLRPRRRRVHRRPLLVWPERSKRHRGGAVLRHHATSGLHGLPGHVRNYHPGPGDRSLCGENEVQRLRDIHCPMGHHCVRAGSPLGVGGGRMAGRSGRAGLCRRNGCPHQLRRSRSGGCHHLRQEAGLRPGAYGAS